ncbi:hypothetical protein [Sporosarcina sp. HYO08]|uniref:hypothetical protein n=1 Tax=Sporosarcina sp. HYO08 TaxID=1759557 RepID=UPI0009E7C628|nr:hypothetical protein [Sporosarcina sp. HYO08]
MNESALPQLSPPWVTYFNELKNSIDNDPLVSVVQLIGLPHDAGYLIPIIVQERKKARALATILELEKNFGNVPVYVAVIYDGAVVDPLEESGLTPQRIVKVFEEAFNTNRYFEFAVVERFTPGTEAVYPVFSKRVIQFFNDDLSDLYNNFNAVAASVFKDVLREEINDIIINPSTAEKNSQ